MNATDMQALVREVAIGMHAQGGHGGDSTFLVDPTLLRERLEQLHPRMVQQLDRRSGGVDHWVKRLCPSGTEAK